MTEQQLSYKQRALDYHAYPKPGKLSVESSKPCATGAELSLAYTPGVSEPVR
jgi:malate dehydrogenase (oxaloacetate-decarboxylating)(NADP+)